MFEITGDITITDNTGNQHTISCDDIDFEIVEAREEAQGTHTTHEGTYEDNENDFSITVDVYEYPVGAFNSVNVEVEDGTLISQNIQGQLTE